VLAAIGFLVVGLPGAGLWAVIFLVAAVLQVGILVLIPAVIFVFATATTTTAVVFLIWCAIVALLDNVLKPMLLGRGASVPTAVVFLGAIVWIRRDGDYWPVRRRNRFVSGLQTVSRLDRG
jgi:predicted PurR-regulated permease PerM